MLGVIALIGSTASCAIDNTPKAGDTLPNSTYVLQGQEVSRTDLTHEKLVKWSDQKRLDDHTLELQVWGADTSCYGWRVVIAELPEKIVTETHRGIKPTSNGKCLAEGGHASLVITTKEPIGDKFIVQSE